jgi:hypothetical protein
MTDFKSDKGSRLTFKKQKLASQNSVKLKVSTAVEITGRVICR